MKIPRKHENNGKMDSLKCKVENSKEKQSIWTWKVPPPSPSHSFFNLDRSQQWRIQRGLCGDSQMGKDYHVNHSTYSILLRSIIEIRALAQKERNKGWKWMVQLPIQVHRLVYAINSERFNRIAGTRGFAYPTAYVALKITANTIICNRISLHTATLTYKLYKFYKFVYSELFSPATPPPPLSFASFPRSFTSHHRFS